MTSPKPILQKAAGETLIQPLDKHNQTLLAHVHPSTYINPLPKKRYHLVVIGAGPGGLVTAAAAAGLGAKVALVERHLMGGDCLNVGCVPSKAIIRAARSWHESLRSEQEFGGPRVSNPGDFAKVMERMRKVRAGLSRVDSVSRFSSLGVDVFIGEGQFTDPQTLEVNGAKLKFRRAVLATGARAAIPNVPGLLEAKPRTNETIFWLTELPKRLVILGAGPIGCEMAQSFSRLGSQVTLVDLAPHVLVREDADAAEIVQQALLQDGVTLALHAKILSVESKGLEKIIHLEAQGRNMTLPAEEILVAAGRQPNVENLNLGNAGIAFDKRGITVNDRLQTSNNKVYAIGDVCSKYQFTHTADAQARMVIANALFFGRGKVTHLVVPWCTYTSPEIAHVGMYEKDAKEAGLEVDTITVPLEEVDRAVLDGASTGFCRVHVKKGSDRVLGATLVAEHAGEMIGEMALAITHQIGLSKIGTTIHPYPTQAEVFRKAADTWRRSKLTPTVKRIFALFFKIFS